MKTEKAEVTVSSCGDAPAMPSAPDASPIRPIAPAAAACTCSHPHKGVWPQPEDSHARSLPHPDTPSSRAQLPSTNQLPGRRSTAFPCAARLVRAVVALGGNGGRVHARHDRLEALRAALAVRVEGLAKGVVRDVGRQEQQPRAPPQRPHPHLRQRRSRR